MENSSAIQAEFMENYECHSFVDFSGGFTNGKSCLFPLKNPRSNDNRELSTHNRNP